MGFSDSLIKAGLLFTVPLAITSFALGLLRAFVTAQAMISSNKVLKSIAETYVWIIRSIPLLVQLVIIFYERPSIGVNQNIVVVLPDRGNRYFSKGILE